MNHNDKMPRQTASVFRRLGAMLYDGFLLLGVLFIGSAVIAAIGGGFAGEQTIHNGDVVNELPPVLNGLLYQLYLGVLVTGFYGFFWVKNAQTLGMQAWHIRIEQADGSAMSWRASFLRIVAAIPSFALCGLGYWWAWVDREGLTWHDRLSGTRVYRIAKVKR